MPTNARAKIVLIWILSVAVLVALFFFDLLSIQSMLLVWNFSIVLSIILWEREKKRNILSATPEYAGPSGSQKNETRWVEVKKEIERTRDQLGKTKDPKKLGDLRRRARSLTNELRRLEWSIRETNMDEMYKAHKFGLRELDPRRMKSAIEKQSEEAYARRKKLEFEARNGQNLEAIANTVLETLHDEPDDSLPASLSAVSNELRAGYNAIKKKTKRARILKDYWATLYLIRSVIERSPLEVVEVQKYVSSEYYPTFRRLVKAISDRNLVLKPSTEVFNQQIVRPPNGRAIDPDGGHHGADNRQRDLNPFENGDS